jgi:hypothetical protein
MAGIFRLLAELKCRCELRLQNLDAGECSSRFVYDACIEALAMQEPDRGLGTTHL